MQNQIILKWSVPIRVSEGLEEVKGKKGLYFLLFGSDIFHLSPYYFGKSRNKAAAKGIAQRIYEHVTSILGGNYIVLHGNSLTNFNHLKDEVNNKNQIYFPRIDNVKNLIKNNVEIQHHAVNMVNKLWYSYAEVNEKYVDEIEKVMIRKIGKDRLINKTGYPKEDVWDKWKNSIKNEIDDKESNLSEILYESETTNHI